MGAEARHTLEHVVCDYTVIPPMPMPLPMPPAHILAPQASAAGGALRPPRRAG